jgi:hypothetical protein
MHTRDLSRTENFGLSRGTSGFVDMTDEPELDWDERSALIPSH